MDDSLGSSLVGPYGRSQQPESNSVSAELNYAGPRDLVLTYDDAPSINNPVHLDSMGRKSNSLQYSEGNHYQFGNPSIPHNGYASVRQPTDASDSFDYTLNGNSQLDEEKLSLQPQSRMDSYRSRVVVAKSGMYFQQGHDSLQNLSLPQESQASLSLGNHDSLATQYGSYNRHNHQTASQHQLHKFVVNNHSALLGEVNQGAYQHQVGRPNVDIGVGQCTSQEQAAKVVLPNRSAVLGEANHVAYHNQIGRPNDATNVSQYHPNKVVLPNHSAVLAERNQNLPSDAQHQSNFSLTRSGPVSSADQTTSSNQNISLPSNGMDPQPGSVMTQRNRKLDMQNQQNLTIPPALVQEPGSNYSIYRDQKGEVHSQDQYHPNGVALPSALAHVPQQQIHQQSQHHAHVESNPMQQHSSGDCTVKKVFILHFNDTVGDITGGDSPVLKLGMALRRMKVDVTLDLFEFDNPPNSWALWSEQKISESDVVLCIITENFYHKLTNNDRVLGYSVYNLMNSSNKIIFRAVFIDSKKEMDYIPPAMRGATCYCISSNRLTPNDDEFANLYAFLTGQNRIMKPPLGNMIKLAPKRSRFGNFSGSSGPPAPAYNNSRNMQQQQQQKMMHQPMAPRQPPPAVGPSGGAPDVDQANFIFMLLGGDTTPIKSVHSHNQMLMLLASKLMAEWEALGRMLNVSEPDMYAIKADNIHSVKEQAVQMFQHWMRKNGSRATLGVLTTAVYDSGPQYWNLLDTINKYAPQQ